MTKWLCSLTLALLLTATHATAHEEGYADLVEKLAPSVVNIFTKKLTNANAGPVDNFFGRRFGTPRSVRSLGSGFILESDGTIITNAHVIEGADEIKVKFANGETVEAKLVGKDERTDLAVLKVDVDRRLPSLRLARSEEVAVGEPVFVIGNPLGIGTTVTAGIVSAINRNINSGPYDDFIQTDAAINRGNSGGPIFNVRGEVLGVVTSILSPTGYSIGVGFAVPISTVAPVVEQLQTIGEVRRGWLGVQIQEVTPDIAESIGMSDARGALVVQVQRDSPAQKAGLEAGDVVLSFDGKDVDAMQTLPRIVAATPPNSSARIVVLRDGRRTTLTARIERLEEERTSQRWRRGADGDTGILGMQVQPLTPPLREEWGVPGDLVGLLVVGVDPQSDAADKGIKEGNVVLQIGNRRVASVEDALDAVDGQQGRNRVLLLVYRGGRVGFVVLSHQG